MYSSLMIGFWGCIGSILAWLPLNSFSSCLWLMCVTHSDVLMPLYRLSDFLMASSPAVTFVVNKVLEIRGCWELSQGRVEAQQEIRAHLSSLSHSLTHSTPPSCTELLLMSLHPLVSSSGKQEPWWLYLLLPKFFGVLFFSPPPLFPPLLPSPSPVLSSIPSSPTLPSFFYSFSSLLISPHLVYYRSSWNSLCNQQWTSNLLILLEVYATMTDLCGAGNGNQGLCMVGKHSSNYDISSAQVPPLNFLLTLKKTH